MIIKVIFEDGKKMMFGDSYKDWNEQVEEYMRRCAEGLKRPIKVEKSNSKWISWGGLKWCAEENFQYQLNREGCQQDDIDNPNPRQYSEMRFEENDKKLKEVLEFWKSGQRMLKINALNDEEYKRYNKGELKIVIN